MEKKLIFQIFEILAKINRKYRFPFSRRIFNIISPIEKWKDNSSDIIIKYDTNLKINVNPASYIEWHIFFYGYFEKYVVDLFMKLIKKDYCVFDVGANIGCHTLIASSLVGNDGKVISFEPHPKIFEKLKQNLEINKITNVRVFQNALADSCGDFILYSFRKDESNQGISSLIPNIDQNIDKIIIKTKTLDEVMRDEKLSKLNFIKIDVEGFEFKVLIGARESIVKYRPFILFEYNEVLWNKLDCNLNSLKNFFFDLNYSFYILNDNYLLSVGKTKFKEFNIFAFPIEKHDEIFNKFSNA